MREIIRTEERHVDNVDRHESAKDPLVGTPVVPDELTDGQDV